MSGKYPETRMKHSYAVARYMYEKALADGKNEEYAREMYVLGYLHDVAYEFGDKFEHNIEGADLLGKAGYKYAEQIRHHGVAETVDEWVYEDYLLNTADFHVNGRGEPVTEEERVEDLISRYGEESLVAEKARAMVQALKKYERKEGAQR